MSQPVPAIIHLQAGGFRAEISPFGAALTRFRLHEHDLILSLRAGSSPALNDFYAGSIIGPVANRITNGHVPIDGQVFQMERNEAGQTALHSGFDGLHACHWTPHNQTSSHVSLTCQLLDGHSGLPGNRDITVTYVLDQDGLTITITGQTDKKTPLNIVHHPYWALETDQSKTLLTINAHSYLPTCASALPNGHISPIAQTEFDFTVPRAIGADANLDYNWCLGTDKPDSPRHAASLRASTGLQLDIATTEVGLQVYTGSGLPDLQAKDCAGLSIEPNAGIALEPQGWPDAPNKPAFPSIMVEKGQVYRQTTRYTIFQT